MDDELDEFIRRHKVRVAADKARLEEPPYLEIKVRHCRSYGSTSKENIPPTFTAPGKDESCNVGLPLGLEYERKKQRLQHELKMDYRRYMAQVDGIPKQRSVLQRNVTSLTEDEDDQRSTPVLSKHWNHQGGLTKQDSDDEEHYNDELEQTESKRHLLLETDPRCKKNQEARNDGRGKMESLGVGGEDRRWRELSKNEKLTMGLFIGAADPDKVLQRKKERYRQELKEQIAEQHRNKKREKDLELKVAATGATDPEKQPERILQFGLNRGKGPLCLKPFDETDSLSRPLPSNEKTGGGWEGPCPEHPHVAFQSPLLEYSSVLGLGEDDPSPNRHPVSRNPVFLPHPPSSLSESYRSPCLEPYQSYKTRILRDPNMAHYAHYSVPGPEFPLAYWNVPPRGTVPTKFGNHSPNSCWSFPDPLVNGPSNDVVDPLTEAPQFARGKIFASQPDEFQLQEQDKYKAYLKQQIEEKMRKKAVERDRLRLEEEKEEKRLSEQRQRIQREYEEEQEKKKQKEVDQRAKNEELIRLAEQRRMDAEKKKKKEEEAEEKESTMLKMRQYERERQTRVEEVHREPSPPIPTLQRKHGWHQRPSRPPSVTSQHSAAPLSECCLSGRQSPPVPACRNQLRAAGDQRDIFSELSALRRQLRSEQKRLEAHLQQDNWEELDSPVSMRLQEPPEVDVFDMARLRLQAPVRRPNSKKMELRNPLHIHDSFQLKYPVNVDGESKLGSSEDDKEEKLGIASRRSQDSRDSNHQFARQRSTVQDDPLGEASPAPQTPEPNRIHQLPARVRRRLARQSQLCHQELAASSQPDGAQDDYLRPLGVRMQQEADLRSEQRK
uniref:Centrosome and spindle pole associated protein 1 n=1 Tax=Nothobranchius korthausae TaxID=1143690 RepID=A0A1A8F3T1_9TELE